MRWRQLLLIALLLPVGCRKLLDPGAPVDRMTNSSTFNTDETAAAVLTGLYYNMSAGGGFMGSNGISYLCGLSADEFLLQQEDELSLSLYHNHVQPTNVPFWRVLYKYIYDVNLAIEGLSASKRLTPGIKRQLIGEAKFVRAFCYFYLVNLFGNVPLVMTTDYKVNASMYRTPAPQIYQQLMADLQDALQLLRVDYLQADIVSVTSERVRPNKWAAMALLARVQLYRENWSAAMTAATAVIDNRGVYDTVSLQQVFGKESREAIWQLQPVDKSFIEEALLFTLQRPVHISATLLQAFENEDLRKVYWLGGTAGRFPNKYQYTENVASAKEYLVLLRLAEQYLIRAEARLHTGDINGARADLNVIRTRARLRTVTTADMGLLMEMIQQERRIELFSEWGHRWLDLKRRHAVDAIMPAAARVKGGSWEAYEALYPIPHSERLLNGNLSQNEGYFH
jgi:starch-binding outer membrane protein, SusD/RagB family